MKLNLPYRTLTGTIIAELPDYTDTNTIYVTFKLS